LFANVSGRMFSDNALTLVDGKNRSEHALVFCVWLAKVKIRHINYHRQKTRKDK
jgi:hypothetical protein